MTAYCKKYRIVEVYDDSFPQGKGFGVDRKQWFILWRRLNTYQTIEQAQEFVDFLRNGLSMSSGWPSNHRRF